MKKFEEYDAFAERHIGPRAHEIQEMLEVVGASSLDELIDQTIPRAIRLERPLELHSPATEAEVLERARELGAKNQVWRSLIGQGYSDTVTPPVIQRNILENPGWYTQYTPYQAEIAQGRLEALLNFQTAVSELTGLPIANASLLDEATAAAEAMSMCYGVKTRGQGERFFVSELCHPQTIDVVRTRAKAVGIDVRVGDHESLEPGQDYFGVLVQYPTTDGEILDYSSFARRVHDAGALVVAAADLLSLLLLAPPAEWGADVAVGNSQRFGVPLGYGGPHAAFFATKEEYQRRIPGRIVGVSKDADGNAALRLALQTREQHIRRDKATSNICTAQVLLAVMAGAYAVYHGPEGLRKIAQRVHRYTCILAEELKKRHVRLSHERFFDALRLKLSKDEQDAVLRRSRDARINLRSYEDGVGIALDEATTIEEVAGLVEIATGETVELHPRETDSSIPSSLRRSDEILTHPVFHEYRSETEMLRYLHRLQDKDLSLTHSMIPLGSCTMKLNGTAEMMPVTWPEFARIHPFAPLDQTRGYQELIDELDELLCEATGFAAFSMQPNAGSQGELAGLLVIRAYHQARGEGQRDICLIPTSAHGTNPASAIMAGLRVVSVKCDENGNIDPDDLRAKSEKHGDQLSAMMITYPSTHGVFEEAIRELIEIVHQAGGQVYMDGANLNAQLGLTRPADFGADVCHLNLHKTFCIPHGGGGPGMGPIGVGEHLKPYLPGHRYAPVGGEQAIGAIAAAPWGSPSILPISWAYIKLMGTDGMTRATEVAILNANYVAKRLEGHFDVLYKGRHNRVAHECILDLRRFKRTVGIDVNDVAKRLMDYGFHAPTVAWPVVETVMVEPTESESKAELDRFCDAMIAIRKEIAEVERGADPETSPLKNSPHTAKMVASPSWSLPYTREQGAFPAEWLKEHKFWPPVRRIDNVYGDRNLFCTCPPMEELIEA